jgi:putative addiction module CopG family antidote
MAIRLTPEPDQLVQEKIATGRYKSVEEVLIAAMRALREEEDTSAAIREGWEDVLAGRVRSLEEANAEFRRKYGVPREARSLKSRSRAALSRTANVRMNGMPPTFLWSSRTAGLLVLRKR